MSHERENGDGPDPETEARRAPDERDVHGSEDATLGGYFRVHDRPPAFEGSDGHPYTVSIETERTPDLRAPWQGFLVFPRWAKTGVGIVGHLETPILWKGTSSDEVLRKAGGSSLLAVQEHLEEAIAGKRDDPGGRDAPPD